jgi:xylan 1,4-beta-xylosidase
MVWNYHDNDLQGPAEPVSIKINNLEVKTVIVTHYRIDDKHSNSYEVWKKMGSPQDPTAAQISKLEQAGQLQTLGKPQQIQVKSGSVLLNIELPRQAVSLLKLDWK